MNATTCKKCAEALPDGHGTKLCEACLQRRRDRTRKVLIATGITAAAALVAYVVVRSSPTASGTPASDEDEGEELPPDAHRRFEMYLGTGKADDVAADVRAGELTAAEAEEWCRSVEDMHERSHHRRDVEPRDWRAFEEGWRPEGW